MIGVWDSSLQPGEKPGPFAPASDPQTYWYWSLQLTVSGPRPTARAGELPCISGEGKVPASGCWETPCPVPGGAAGLASCLFLAGR